jgi:PAS domain S-box-containing protein
MTTSLLQDSNLATVLDAAPIAMLVVDQQSRIVYSNKQASATFGYSADELRGTPIDRLIPARTRDGHHRLVSQFFDSPNHRVMGVGREVIGVDSHGREIPMEIGLTPLQTSSGTLAIAAVVDITERRRRETESTLARIVQSAVLPTEAHFSTRSDSVLSRLATCDLVDPDLVEDRNERFGEIAMGAGRRGRLQPHRMRLEEDLVGQEPFAVPPRGVGRGA